MMKSTYIYKYTLGLLAAAVLLYGCAADRKERGPVMMEKVEYAADSVASMDHVRTDSIGEEFVPDSLTPRELEAFVQIGLQKLRDYADYMAIALDLHYDKEFRKQAEEQAMKQFINDGKELGDKWIDIAALSKELRGHSVKITIDSIEVGKFPQPGDDGLYRGRCTFRQIITAKKMTKQASTIIKVNRYSAGIVVMKIKKQFGNETREVWEVGLDRFEGIDPH